MFYWSHSLDDVEVCFMLFHTERWNSSSSQRKPESFAQKNSTLTIDTRTDINTLVSYSSELTITMQSVLKNSLDFKE